ncbi:GTP cyclohydrolase 1 feedback regulatory protein-like [Thrips palmi]|uniref:GTP cyclohydrolase 1 feedback regulatory protein n=1 Tax=Thrips palmi TaxID=161013 RepID=A0A6P8YEW8_THRPL|nr:GTP cyclohydrolase 1 feedback regulatory protein-like [Thrips palmi]
MPYVLVTTQIRLENGPTFVGDEHSDPELMQYLDARKVTEPGNNFSTYLTDLNVRQVLNQLEKRCYSLVGMSGMGQTCVWTMWKSPTSTNEEESDK